MTVTAGVSEAAGACGVAEAGTAEASVVAVAGGTALLSGVLPGTVAVEGTDVGVERAKTLQPASAKAKPRGSQEKLIRRTRSTTDERM